MVPWQQLINPVDLMICDAAEGVGDPCLRIDTVELGGFNQGIDDGRGFTAAFGSNKHVVFAINGDAAHGSFGCVVVEFK